MTMVAPDRRGYVTAHAARTPRGATSSGSGMPWEVTAQFGITAASSAGIEIYSNAGTELTVDLLGWFTGPQTPMTQSAFAGNPVPTQRVIAIGDSTMAGVDRNRAWAQLRGADFDFRARSCRRLIRLSCRGREGPIPPPNALDDPASLPYGIYDVAVIMTGYNDGASDVAAAVPVLIREARAKGIRRIIWMTHAREFRVGQGRGRARQADLFDSQLVRALSREHQPRRRRDGVVGDRPPSAVLALLRRHPSRQVRRARCGRFHVAGRRPRHRTAMSDAPGARRVDGRRVPRPQSHAARRHRPPVRDLTSGQCSGGARTNGDRVWRRSNH